MNNKLNFINHKNLIKINKLIIKIKNISMNSLNL